MTILGCTALSALAVWLLCWPVYRFLIARNIIDRPNERSSHTRPTARGGGIAIMLVISAGSFCMAWEYSTHLLWILPLLALILAAVSFVDDLKSVPPSIRFGCHALAASVSLLFLNPGIPFGLNSWGIFGLALTAALFFLWVAGYTNAFNFMDGINGIAGFQAVTTGLGMALIAQQHTASDLSPPVLFSALLAGAGLGFLPHNFPRARMFMGDVSSAPLGFLLSFAVIWLSSTFGWELLVPLALMHSNFVLDAAITLVRRILRGDKWYLPHREHFYQRFIRSGKSHSFVTLWELLLQVITFLLLLFYLRVELPGKAAAAVGVILLWSAFFLWAEMTFRRHQQTLLQPNGA